MSDVLSFLNFNTKNQFAERHIGPDSNQQKQMLKELELDSLDALIKETVPHSILQKKKLTLPNALSESEALEKLKTYADKNEVWQSLIGMGYYGTEIPNVILRNVLENPGWYTAYTPYQPEISQGRLEALINFQQMEPC